MWWPHVAYVYTAHNMFLNIYDWRVYDPFGEDFSAGHGQNSPAYKLNKAKWVILF